MMPKSVVGDFKNLLEVGRTSNLSPDISKISRSPIRCQNLSPEILIFSGDRFEVKICLEISSYRAALSTVVLYLPESNY